jgi:hypothetical protein
MDYTIIFITIIIIIITITMLSLYIYKKKEPFGVSNNKLYFNKLPDYLNNTNIHDKVPSKLMRVNALKDLPCEITKDNIQNIDKLWLIYEYIKENINDDKLDHSQITNELNKIIQTFGTLPKFSSCVSKTICPKITGDITRLNFKKILQILRIYQVPIIYILKYLDSVVKDTADNICPELKENIYAILDIKTELINILQHI